MNKTLVMMASIRWWQICMMKLSLIHGVVHKSRISCFLSHRGISLPQHDNTERALRKLLPLLRRKTQQRPEKKKTMVSMLSIPPQNKIKGKQCIVKLSSSRRGERYNNLWSDDIDNVLDENQLRIFQTRSPFPIMPSSLFINLAQSQFELLANTLVHTTVSEDDSASSSIKPETQKASSMILYLPIENKSSGQLEFVPAVTYPNPSSERVFIASDSSFNGTHQPPIIPSKSVLGLPGFTKAKDLIPSYPFISSSPDSEEDIDAIKNIAFFSQMEPDSSVGVSVVEEISSGILSQSSSPSSLSVTMFSGMNTLGVLIIRPHKDNDDKHNQWKWTRQDKLQVTRASKSLAFALSLDNERASAQFHSDRIRMSFSDSLHQVKSPLQALRTFGKLLQRQLAEEIGGFGPTMQRVPFNITSNDNDLAWGRRQRHTLKLVEDMIKQGDRVVDLIEPMNTFLDDGRYLLHGDIFDENENITLDTSPLPQSSAIDLYQGQLIQTVSMPILLEFNMEMTFPHDILGPVVYAFQAISREFGINFDAIGFDPDAELPGVKVCPRHLVEAVSNLLDNAIKYTRVKKRGKGRPKKNSLPQIKVTLCPNEPALLPGATLYIEDNGPGILKDEVQNVFDRGFRGAEVRNSVPGKGLGLGMSKQMILQMGGILDILEMGPSNLGGATFRIILFREPTLKTLEIEST